MFEKRVQSSNLSSSLFRFSLILFFNISIYMAIMMLDNLLTMMILNLRGS